MEEKIDAVDKVVMSENIEDYLDESGNVKEEFKKVKKCFLKDLPRKQGRGANSNKMVINWNECGKHKIKFIYNMKIGEFDIIKKISSKKILCVYKTKEVIINRDSLAQGKIGELIGINSKAYRLKVGEILNVRSGKIEIIEQVRMDKNKEKGYKYKCLNDNTLHICREYHILKSVGCPVCANQIVVKGINDIGTTNPEFNKYFAK